MRRLLITSIAFLFPVAMATAQVANLDVRVVNLQAPPVTILNCAAGWEAPAWATEAEKSGPMDENTLPVFLQVQNTGPQTVYAYRVMISTYDAFGDYLDTIRATSIAALAPQGTDQGRWSLRMRMPVCTWTVVIFLEAVRYQDGTTWRVDPQSIAAYVPSTAPVRFQSWHIIPDPREIFNQQLKDEATGVAPPG